VRQWACQSMVRLREWRLFVSCTTRLLAITNRNGLVHLDGVWGLLAVAPTRAYDGRLR
jgi:hypothetical protein